MIRSETSVTSVLIDPSFDQQFLRFCVCKDQIDRGSGSVFEVGGDAGGGEKREAEIEEFFN